MATALITGGTSGIGAEFARQLAARGDDVVLVARNPDRLAEFATELKDRYGVGVETMVADLGVREEVQQVAERLASTEQPIDVLINNAGFGVPGRLATDDPSAQEYAIDVMIRAVLILVGGGRPDDASPRCRDDHQRVQHGGLRDHGDLLGDQGLGHQLHRGSGR